jgi:hypothetical protein
MVMAELFTLRAAAAMSKIKCVRPAAPVPPSACYGLDPAAGFIDIAALMREARMANTGRRIVWLNVITVISAAILIGAEVFGAAFAGSWALATLFDLGGIGQRILDGIFVLCGIAIMVQFVRAAHRIEPFTARA